MMPSERRSLFLLDVGILLWILPAVALAFGTAEIPSISRPRPKFDEQKADSIQWLIIGGGIHGVHIAARLLGEGGVDAADARIVDDGESLLRRWKTRAAATGMEYLRSSASFHLDPDERSLRRQFGRPRRGKGGRPAPGGDRGALARDYDRPRLDVFNRHCDGVVEKYGLDRLHVRGIATKIDPTDHGVKVVVSSPDADGADNSIVYTAKNVVLALGNDEPSYPDWVDENDIESGLVEHLFDLRNDPRAGGRAGEGATDVAVIGGGMSAAHKALELARRRSGNAGTGPGAPPRGAVHLVCRHALREQQFDTHQDWMMGRSASERSRLGGGSGVPERQRRFASTADMGERRRIIARERVPGTVTPAVHRGDGGLRYAIASGDVRWHRGEVLEKRKVGDGGAGTRVQLRLSCGEAIEVDRVLLATGFGRGLPGGELVRDLAEWGGLEVSGPCRHPVVDEGLAWHSGAGSRIYVVGALAELEIGPSARNIAGARLAAERILRAVQVLA